jgi:hypothetical protein
MATPAVVMGVRDAVGRTEKGIELARSGLKDFVHVLAQQFAQDNIELSRTDFTVLCFEAKNNPKSKLAQAVALQTQLNNVVDTLKNLEESVGLGDGASTSKSAKKPEANANTEAAEKTEADPKPAATPNANANDDANANNTASAPVVTPPVAATPNINPKWMEPTVFKSPMSGLDQIKATQKGVFPFLNVVAQIFCELNEAGPNDKALQLVKGDGHYYIPRLCQVLTADEKLGKLLTDEKEKVLSEGCVTLGIDALVNSYSLDGDGEKGQKFLANFVLAQLAVRGNLESKSVIQALNDCGRVYEKSQKPNDAKVLQQMKDHTYRPIPTTPNNPPLQLPKNITKTKNNAGKINEETVYTVVGGSGKLGRPNCKPLDEERMYSTVLGQLATKLQTALFKKVNGYTQASPIEKDKKGVDTPPKFIEVKLNDYLENLQKTEESEPPLNGAKRLHQFAVLLLAACPDLGKVTLEEGKLKTARKYTVSPFLVGLSKLSGKLKYLESNKADKAVESLCAELKELIKTECKEKYTQPTAVEVPEEVKVGAKVDLVNLAKVKIDKWQPVSTSNQAHVQICRDAIRTLFENTDVQTVLREWLTKETIERLVPSLLDSALSEFGNEILPAHNPLGNFINSFTSDPNGQPLQGGMPLRHIHLRLCAYLPEVKVLDEWVKGLDGGTSSTQDAAKLSTRQSIRDGVLAFFDKNKIAGDIDNLSALAGKLEGLVNSVQPADVCEFVQKQLELAQQSIPSSSNSQVKVAQYTGKLREKLDKLNALDGKLDNTLKDEVKQHIRTVFISDGTSLNLSGNKLASLQLNFFQFFPQLEQLDLSDNPLDPFPKGLRHLQNLKSLSFRNYQRQALPPKLFDFLLQLETLDLSDSQLKRLPVSLKGLTNLKTLKLQTSGPLCELNKEEIHKLLPEMKTGLVVYPDGTREQVEFKTTDKSEDQDGNAQDPQGSPPANTGKSTLSKQDRQSTSNDREGPVAGRQPHSAAFSRSQPLEGPIFVGGINWAGHR